MLRWLSGCASQVVFFLGKSSTWIYGHVRQRFCRCLGSLSRTRMTLNRRFMGSRYSFQTSHYQHGFSLTTAPLTWNPFCACIPALHTRPLPYFQESGHDKLYKKYVHMMEHLHILPHIMCSFFSLYCQFIYAARHLQQQQCSPVQLSLHLLFL